MRRVEEIEKAVARLSAGEAAEFRTWFAEFDAEFWDRQLETAPRSHAVLERMAAEALAQHRAGLTVELDPEKL